MRLQAEVGADRADIAGRIASAEPAESQVSLERILAWSGPVDRVLVASLAVSAAAIGCLLAAGIVSTAGGAFAVVLSPPVWLLALVPPPALQLGLALSRRPSGPVEDASLRAPRETDRLSSGYARRLLAMRFRGVLAAFLGGLWILLTIVIGMAVAGGVVWL